MIHDEAALASTREQIRLLRAVEASGGRLIAVGDPRQNQPVGAGGLWTRIEDITRTAAAHVELTHNQRARDPADRRDQARFREGRAELAIRGYAARDRVHLHPDQHDAEDQALDAAHADRTSGRTAIVIAQTSNDHLDELNARAQAVRRQQRQLGDESVPVPGRPYELHAGDDVQVRRTIHHQRGQLRNGTTAVIANVDAESGAADVRLADGTELRLHQDEIAKADLRLAYVQHPFPAQGHTTDTGHLIVTGNSTLEGSYVALTRARDETHIYAADAPDRSAEVDRLQDIADRISRTEPEVPSIQTPLAHEATIHAALHTARPEAGFDRPQHGLAANAEVQMRRPERVPEPVAEISANANSAPHVPNDNAEDEKQPARTWPMRPASDLDAPQRGLDDELKRDKPLTWEP